jgi:hypothetical protein
METITGNVEISGIKRCYVDAQIKINCPQCKSELICDLGDQYLSHPEIGIQDQGGAYCDKCEDHVMFPIKVTAATVTIEYDPIQTQME